MQPETFILVPRQFLVVAGLDTPLSGALDQQITFLYTRDLAASAHFYEEIMAFELSLDQGSCRIYQTTTQS